MYKLEEIIHYLRKFDIDEQTIKKCYEIIQEAESKGLHKISCIAV